MSLGNGPALVGQVGELQMTLQITRAATGKTETVELVGRIDAEALEALTAESAQAQKED